MMPTLLSLALQGKGMATCDAAIDDTVGIMKIPSFQY